MNDAIYLKDIQGLDSSVDMFKAINTYDSEIFPSTLFPTDELEVKAEEYFYRSGDKFLTRIARHWLDASADLTAFFSYLTKSAVAHYGRNWKRIQLAYFESDYNPIENYDMEEVRTPDLSDETNTETDFKTTQNTTISAEGFNSSVPVPTSGTESTTEGTKLDNHQKTTLTRTGNETLTRHGKIGVTTSSALTREELELRTYDFWEQVFHDIDDLLVRGVYETCP